MPSVIRGGCYVLKTVTSTETRSAAIAVSLPSVLRGAGVPVINACPEPSADHVCCRIQWSVAADKILFPSIRLPDVICVELVYQHHKLQRIQLHRLTAAIGAAAIL